MKKTLFLSAILGAALCSSAFGATATVDNSVHRDLNLNSAPYNTADTVIFNITSDTNKQYFANGGQTYSQAIQIGDGSETQGGMWINDGYSNSVTFTGAVTGSGQIKKTGAGTNLCLNFTGDVTGYTGNITLSARANGAAPFFLVFGSTPTTSQQGGVSNYGTPGTAPTTSATKGVSGTGDITFTTNVNTLVYNYAASANPVYITNAITKDGGSAKVQLRGGASYSFEKDVTIDTLTLADNSTILLADSSKKASLGSIEGTGTLKYTGSTQWAFNRAGMASTVTLEGVVTNNVSNVLYNANYGVNAGILKNVQVNALDAGAEQGSITLNGVYGNLKNGGTQRNVTLAGAGLILTEGYTGGSYGFQKLDGSGNLEKRFGVNETFTFDNAAEWTGIFKNIAGTANLTFNGNSKVDIEGRDTTNVTLKGTDYSQMIIKAFNGKTTTVTVSNAADTTLQQFIQDPWGETNGHAALVLNNGHETTVTGWATVDSITLKNSSSVLLGNHSIGTLTMESGSGTLTTGTGNNGSGIANLVINEDAELTLAGAATVSKVTAADGALTVSHNLTVNGAETTTLGTLTVSGGSTIMLNKHNVGTLEVTGGNNFMFSDAGIGSDANHQVNKVNVSAGASLTFGEAPTKVGAITLGAGSILTVGDHGDHNYTLTTTGLTVNGTESAEESVATINANLVVNGGKIIFDNNTTLTMGCSVSIGTTDTVTVVLTQEMVDAIAATGHYDLFTSVESATLIGSNIRFEGAEGVTLKDNDPYSLKWDGNKIYVTPEPATATLSLLALAGLMARRKRH